MALTLTSSFCLCVCVFIYRWTTCQPLSLSVSLSPPPVRPVCFPVRAAEQQHACMFASSTSRSIMEVKERRPYCSLSKSRKDKEGPYTGEMTQFKRSFICLFILMVVNMDRDKPFVFKVSVDNTQCFDHCCCDYHKR